MRMALYVLFILILTLSGCSDRDVVEVDSAIELMDIFRNPVKKIEIHLRPGEYHLEKTAFIDSTCGNCENLHTQVHASFGLRVSGQDVRLIGEKPETTVIHTHAGYGIFVDGTSQILIKGVTVTGGIRDTSAMASDAGIVVKDAHVVIQNCIIRDNIGDSLTISSTISGIMGICLRENAVAQIVNNRIIKNSWDGIALYRQSTAQLLNNYVDGVDRATGRVPGGGRGVGIGVTWDAKATVACNYIARYWKGVGFFVNATGSIKGNVVEDIVTWGISIWDAGKGEPTAEISGNIVYDCGACGIAITCHGLCEERGVLSRNIIVKTGSDERYDSPQMYCAQVPVDLRHAGGDFPVSENALFDNRQFGGGKSSMDMSQEVFVEETSAILDGFDNPYIKSSQFIGYFRHLAGISE